MFYEVNGYLPNPPFEVIGHLCEVRNCVNPEHLAHQSQKDNVRQYKNKITHCPKGHEYNKQNTYYRKAKTGKQKKCRKCNAIAEQKRQQRLRSLK